MNHHRFSSFHNKHIKFIYESPEGGREELSGVVVDIIRYNEKKTPTEYIYIKSTDLKEWQRASETGDIPKKNKLQRIIDIQYITHAQFVI